MMDFAEEDLKTCPRPSADEPVRVFFEIYTNDIMGIDSVNQTATLFIFYIMYWEDPRVIQRDSSKPAAHINAYTWKTGVDPSEIWSPGMELINEISATVHEEEEKTVVHRGDENRTFIAQYMKFLGEVSTMLKLHSFPFDSQTLELIFRSQLFVARDLVFECTKNQTVNMLECLDPKAREHGEFEITGHRAVISSHTYQHTNRMEGMDAAVFSEFRVQYALKRKAGFYVIGIWFKFLVLLLMNLFAFLLDPGDIASRTGVTITLFLTAVALHFSVQGNLPKISYSTKLDWFIVLNYVMMLFVYAEGFLVFLLEKPGNWTGKTWSDRDLWMVDQVSCALVVFGALIGHVWFVGGYFYGLCR